MSEAKTFVGQPILLQVLSCIPTELIQNAAAKHKSDRYYKRIPLKVHLTSLLYGVFSYRNGLREVCEGLLGCEGKLNHLGLTKAPPRSTLSDANRERSYLVFETIYFELLRQYHKFYLGQPIKRVEYS
jgi:hypothetical protein